MDLLDKNVVVEQCQTLTFDQQINGFGSATYSSVWDAIADSPDEAGKLKALSEATIWVMDYHYKPFIVSADFDDQPETIDKERWVAGASVELGDINGPKYKDSRSKFARWLDKKLFGQ
jgi:hypothetical protein